MKRSTAITLCLLAAWSGAAGAQPAPFASAEETRRLMEDEDRIWSESSEFDRAIRNRGHLFGDAALDAYLQQLLDTLYPEFRGAHRIRAVKDTKLNAFALPNGSLYLNIGLIARVENEAQLASVIAHEGAHFIQRHGLRQRQSIKSNTAFALGLGIAGGSIGSLLGNLAAVSSIYGYSRDMEREADRTGFERLMRTGYSAREATRVFELLDAEAKLLDEKEPFMFSSHPRLQERIDSYREIAAQNAGGNGRTESERFLARTEIARQAWLEAELGRAQYKSLIHHLSQASAHERFPAYCDYYLGESYLLRAEGDDNTKAQAAFDAAIATAPDFAPSYRALGLLELKRGNRERARELLRAYLERAPQADDAEYVKGYLEQIDRELVEKKS